MKIGTKLLRWGGGEGGGGGGGGGGGVEGFFFLGGLGGFGEVFGYAQNP